MKQHGQTILTVGIAVAASVGINYLLNQPSMAASPASDRESVLETPGPGHEYEAPSPGSVPLVAGDPMRQALLAGLTQGPSAPAEVEAPPPNVAPTRADAEAQVERERTEIDRLERTVLEGAEAPAATQQLRDLVRDAFELAGAVEGFEVECSTQLCAVRSAGLERENFDQLRSELASAGTGIQNEFIVFGHPDESNPNSVTASIYVSQNGTSIGDLIGGVE